MNPAQPILAEHASQLDPAYRLFDRLTDPALRAEAARLVDFLVGEQVPVPDGLAPEWIPAMRRAVEGAHPDRKCLDLVAAHFPAWAAAVPEGPARKAFFENLPALGPAIADLGTAGMADAIAAVNRDPRLIACIASYALTTKEIVNAAARLATTAPVELLQRLGGAVTMTHMEASKDAERLIPALAAVPDALPALVALAEKSPSSAYGAAKSVGAAMKAAGGARAAFVEDFRLVAESVGISAVGFCLDTLPKLYGQVGAERVRAFVELAAACAREYGVRAGQAFLERKTAAAKAALAT